MRYWDWGGGGLLTMGARVASRQTGISRVVGIPIRLMLLCAGIRVSPCLFSVCFSQRDLSCYLEWRRDKTSKQLFQTNDLGWILVLSLDRFCFFRPVFSSSCPVVRPVVRPVVLFPVSHSVSCRMGYGSEPCQKSPSVRKTLARIRSDGH